MLSKYTLLPIIILTGTLGCEPDEPEDNPAPSEYSHALTGRDSGPEPAEDQPVDKPESTPSRDGETGAETSGP